MKLYVVCPICNKKFKSMNSHIPNIHQLTIGEFKKKYPGHEVTSEQTKKLMSNKKKGIKLTEKHKRNLSKAFSGDKNPFYGKKHTKKTKTLMSRNHADFSGENNPLVKWLKCPENRQAYRAICKEKSDRLFSNEEWASKFKTKLSKAIAQAHIDGKLKSYGRGHKHGYFVSKKQNISIYYRSSYELKFLEICEQNNFIETYKSCNFTIPYTDDKGILKYYVPDFIINSNIIVEIKPFKLINELTNKLKFEAALSFCKENQLIFKVLTENELFN